ncbi:hypothetical protein [Mesorhizobium sp.]|uniref:hypothetical protein n=1 Tax=Mesorhizobium sp. TaxID=1871066 RepID=UPI000FE4E87B|nr:hypothetical protein [Mesorhizobium sp.]RWM29794.1 MAG: hypothetical protein EOR75_31955 [Mesorhizobium sp.]TJV47692.1 MAG: hypothetical protein E5Y01_31810 [Mesorhizobium sp.]
MSTEVEDSERARIRGIIGCEAAKKLPALAETLAYESNLPLETATAALTAAAADHKAATPAPAPGRPAAQRPTLSFGVAESTERHMSKELVQASWSKAVNHANRGVEALGATMGGAKPTSGWSKAVGLANQSVA